MSVIRSYFKDVSKILDAQSKLSSNITNPTLIGESRELFISNFIEKAFPKKFVIGTGEIIDSLGNISKQADIVIYDEIMPSFDYGNSKHFLSGGVLAHIEIKSDLNSDKLIEALKVTKSIKALQRDIDAVMHQGTLPKKISSFIFAYDGMSKENFKQKVLDFYNGEQDIDNFVDAICVLNKYVMIRSRNADGAIENVFLEANENSLMLFFGRLFDAVQKTWLGRADIYKYLGEEWEFPDF